MIQQAGNPALMLRTAPVGTYDLPFASEFSNWRDEQKAWMTTSVLFDQSFHMTDVNFRGRDVKRLFSDVAVNSFANFGKGKAKQLVVVNYDGKLIADAILFAFEDDHYSVVGTGVAARWVQFHAETGGYDVEVTTDLRTVENPGKRRLFRFQLNGPLTQQILMDASGGTLKPIKFFNMGMMTIAGVEVQALNHTMTGVPGAEMTGLELMGPAEQGEAVRAAILEAGKDFGLVQGGARAYTSTSTEGGWIPMPVPAIYTGEKMRAYREWLPGFSLEGFHAIGGSYASDNIEDYYVSPFDVGYGRTVKFDHDFIGREALARISQEPKRQKVWLRWNDDDVARVMASSLFDGPKRAKYIDLPFATYANSPYDQVLSGDRLIGVSTYSAYTVNIGGFASLAMIDEVDVRDGSEVTIVWGETGPGTAKPTVEEHELTTIRARLHTDPLV